MSTAESELVAACEGTVLGQSIESLIAELVDSLEPKQLLVDNIAAVVLAEGGGSGRTRHLRVRASFITDLIERKELNVDHCPGDLQLADILTKVLAGPRHRTLSAMLGLGPISLDARVAAVKINLEPAGSLQGTVGLGVPKVWCWILVLIVQMCVCKGADEQDPEATPLGQELSLLVLLLTFSILFVWEAGKACINSCRSRREEVQVAALRVEAEEQLERRSRRQEAVRRAIASETEGLRRRREAALEVPGPSEAPVHSYVHVQVEAPRPPPPPPLDQGSLLRRSQDSSIGFQDNPSPPIRDHPSTVLSNLPPPPPLQPRGSGEVLPTRREIATQTDERRGISYEELQELQVLTSTSRTPGVVHLFPGCHALRGVNTNRRSFCRYCLQGAGRTGI